MNREDIRKLLGGYATGTLTAEEQQILFAAALDDQELFDALGREQALRDLLRDPAVKGELLAALDTPNRSGFWQWMSRPLVAGLATAGVAGIAVVAVWQGTHMKRPAAEAIVAEMQAPPVPTTETKAPEPRATAQDLAAKSPKAVLPAKRAEEFSVRRDARSKPSPAAVLDQAMSQENLKKEVSAAAPVASPAPPPPPPAAIPASNQLGAVGQRNSTAETVAVQADAALQQTAPVTPVDKLTLNARSLFYGSSFAPRKDAPAPASVGALGGVPPNMPRFAATPMAASSGSVAKTAAAAFSPGVRVSILRGDQEAAVSTLLDPGESVRLKLMPNEDGFLYVAAYDGNAWKMVASGPARRLQPFETPPLPFTGSGQKQVYVMLSRQAQTLTPQSLAGLVRANLVETTLEDRATYVVAGTQDTRPVQVVQPITLTYR